MKSIAMLIVALCIVGCVGPGKLISRLNVGMSEGEVLNVVGNPERVDAKGDTKVFVYEDSEDMRPVYYIVVLKNNFVTQYGRATDFQEVKRYQVDANINQNVRVR